MPKGSEELTQARKDEIISACALLYTTMGFKEITLQEISKATSFTRTSIYNYFQTKEEIFLALLQREYEAWSKELCRLRDDHDSLQPEAFADAVARTLEQRPQMLKILAMNHYDMEGSCRLEKLVEFKQAYKASLEAVQSCLGKFFPAMTETDRQAFIYAFFPFLFGIYPYAYITPKQKEAMDMAAVPYPQLSIYTLAFSFIKKLLPERI